MSNQAANNLYDFLLMQKTTDENVYEIYNRWNELAENVDDDDFDIAIKIINLFIGLKQKGACLAS